MVRQVASPYSILIGKLEAVSKSLSIFSLGVGLMVLVVGWLFGVERFTDLLPTWPSMKVMTALGFVILGMALWLFHGSQRKLFQRLSLFLSWLLVAIAVYTLLDYLFNWSAEFAFRQPVLKTALLPMSPASALILLFSGIGLVSLHGRFHVLAQTAAVATIGVSLLGLIGLLYGLDLFFRAVLYSTLSFHTAICGMAVGVAILFACAQHGFMQTFTAEAGGSILRRLLPAVFILPMIIGWLRLRGEELGWYSTEFGVALFTVATILTFTFLIWRVGRWLNKAEEEKRAAREALRTSEERLRLALQGADLGMFHLDLKTEQVDFTHLLKQQFGMPLDTPDNLSKFAMALHPEDRERVLNELKRALTRKESYDAEYRIVLPSGEVRWIRARGRPVFDEGQQATQFLGITIDITELSRARRQTADYAKSLEKRVEERTARLQATIHSLEDFVYTIAHDLRAPLRAMQGFAVALEEESGRLLDDASKEYCRRIRTAGDRMDRLISDLLEYGQLAHAELPTKRVDLNEEIDAVLAELHEPIEKKHAEVRVDRPLPAVCGEPKVLDQVLLNLLNNALKFVPPDVPPKVHVHAEPRDSHVRLWVEDNGIGIAPEHQERIFGIFERLHTHEQYPGTGIGLAIVQKAVEQMGGRIGVESEVGKGSRFWIELPAVQQCVAA